MGSVIALTKYLTQPWIFSYIKGRKGEAFNLSGLDYNLSGQKQVSASGFTQLAEDFVEFYWESFTTTS